ncbi:MAG: DUF3095 domain-containing protein [Alphaproteobacteria bacterium]|nr:DUF3095 domain-containing protein [Alphaproteobacteria bacterium]
MEPSPSVHVYRDIETFDDFSQVVDPSIYRALPDDWQVCVSDVVGSRDSIAAGHYRAVNMAGAATISALTNAFAGKAFPFIFAGDGARLAVPPDDAEIARDAMAKTARWARSSLDLELRVGMTSVRDVREAGHDVKVARYAASTHADYAMFSGGGVEWVEERLKAGSFTIEPAPPGAMPDLTGLSCQWGPISSRNGVILSMIVKPTSGDESARFADLIRDLLAILERSSRLNPVPEDGPQVTWPSERLRLQACTTETDAGSTLMNRLHTTVHAAIAWILFRTNLRLGGFDPAHYRRQMAVNTDYRKYDDGLMMTIDCSATAVSEIERRLEAAREHGIADYGLHRQDTAVMTCVASSIFSDDHLHFLDGGEGGYSRAAEQMDRAGSQLSRDKIRPASAVPD